MSASVAFFFNQPADQWAITQLLGLKTRDQLHLALHILGLISSSNAEHRKLSFRRLAVDLGYSRQSVKPLKARMVAAGLLAEHTVTGRSGTYSLGPVFTSSRYQQLIEQFEPLAEAGKLDWPFNSSRRKGSSAGRLQTAGVDQSERSTSGSVRVIQGVDQSERSRVDQSERSTIESLREVSLENSLESKPSAEVLPQASAFGSGPAEISEQPNSQEQPDQQQSDQTDVEMTGSCLADKLFARAKQRKDAKESQGIQQSVSVEWWELLRWPEQEQLHQELVKALEGHWLQESSGQQGIFDGSSVECDDGSMVLFVELASFRGWSVVGEDHVMMSVLGDVAKHHYAPSLVEQ